LQRLRINASPLAGDILNHAVTLKGCSCNKTNQEFIITSLMPETKEKIKLDGFAPLLQVFDMPTSLHFYRDILNFEVVQSSGEGDDVDWVLLQYDNIQLMLNTAYEKNARPGKPDANAFLAHRDTTLYFGCPDVFETYQILTSRGLQINPPFVTGYGWNALAFSDPDNYSICFHWPRNNS
jgi:glyoxylase I family protein